MNLGWCELTSQDAAKIIEGLHKLESLDLDGNDFSGDVKELADAFNGKKIKKLSLNDCNLTSKNAAKIIKSLPDEIENLYLIYEVSAW